LLSKIVSRYIQPSRAFLDFAEHRAFGAAIAFQNHSMRLLVFQIELPPVLLRTVIDRAAANGVENICRAPQPWSDEETVACYIVRDGNGQALAYVYYEEEAELPEAAARW
jgi:hypothetical protein